MLPKSALRLFKESALGRFFHTVTMSVCVFATCPFSCNFFRGLSLALRSHDQVPASHWSTLPSTTPPIFIESAHWADLIIESRCPYVCMSVCPFSCNFFRGLSLAVRSHDQIPASHWSTLLPYPQGCHLFNTI